MDRKADTIVSAYFYVRLTFKLFHRNPEQNRESYGEDYYTNKIISVTPIPHASDNKREDTTESKTI